MAATTMTSEKRSEYALCGAKKKNGEKCRAFAGQGTDHPGIGSCRHHLGNTAAHRKAAAKTEATQRMATMGAPLADITPASALMGLLRATAGHVSWLAAEVADLDGLDSGEAVHITNMYAEERDRLTRSSKAALDTGIGKAEVELAEKQTEAIAKAINAAMSHVGGLSQAQKRDFGRALRTELASLAQPPSDAEELAANDQPDPAPRTS